MELLGVSEAARRLRIDGQTLRRWETRGIITPMRDSANRRIYLAEDIEKLVRSRGQSAARVVNGRLRGAAAA